MDELLGIEHLVNKNAPSRLQYECRVHVARVLKAHKEMCERNDPSLEDLASVAVMSSSRSTQKARLRATFAA
jgi:hypothetical protein